MQPKCDKAHRLHWKTSQIEILQQEKLSEFRNRPVRDETVMYIFVPVVQCTIHRGTNLKLPCPYYYRPILCICLKAWLAHSFCVTVPLKVKTKMCSDWAEILITLPRRCRGYFAFGIFYYYLWPLKLHAYNTVRMHFFEHLFKRTV